MGEVASSKNPPLVAIAGGLDGTTLYFRHIAAHLGDCFLLHLEAPGLYGECEPLSSVEALARSQADRLLAHGAFRVLLTGWSFASMVVHHLAWLLEHRLEVQVVAIDPLWALFPRPSGLAPPQDRDRVRAASQVAQARYQPRVLGSPALYVIAASHGAIDTSRLAALHAHGSHSSIERVAGDHKTLLGEPGARHIAALIQRHAHREVKGSRTGQSGVGT
jgi:thioesterase domain-containing protein